MKDEGETRDDELTGLRARVADLERNAALHDVTEAELRANEARYRGVFDASRDALLLADGETGTITDVNARACELMGRNRAELIGMHQSELHPPEERERYPEIFRDHSIMPASSLGGLEIQRPGGERIPVDICAASFEADGRAHVLGSFRDMRERHRVDAELRSANEQLAAIKVKLRDEQSKLMQAERLSSIGLLSSGVAHEINNPLSGIMGAIKAIRHTRLSEDELAEYLDAAQDGLERIRQTVRGLLDYARQRPPAPRQLDLSATVESALRLVAPGAHKKRIEMVVSPVGRPITLRADQSQLMQALVNVLMNAIQASPTGSAVEVTVGATGAWSEISIRDRGPGIAPDIRDKVCDPFFSTKPEGQGTGLGLSITLGIVQAHDGELQIGVHPQGGAVVSLRFPRGDDSAE